MGLPEQFAARFGNSTRHGVKPATLTRVTPGVRSVGQQSAGTQPTTTTHACKAFMGTFRTRDIDGTLVRSTDRMICVLAATITPAAVPEPGDRLTFDAVEYVICDDGVSRDAAAVLYTCHVRGS